MKLKPGDTVRIIGERGTAKIRAILTDMHGALITFENAPRTVSNSTECGCGSHLKILIEGRCGECATVDQMNRWIVYKGFRPCPHSHHSSDEDFAACAYDGTAGVDCSG